MSSFRFAFLLGALLASGCYSGPAQLTTGDAGTSDAPDDSPPEAAVCVRMLPDCPSTPPSYQQTVAPILANRCVGCHYAGSSLAREDLSTYAGIHANFGTALNQVYGCIMPPSTAAQLTADEKTTLLTWLVCGAPNN